MVALVLSARNLCHHLIGIKSSLAHTLKATQWPKDDCSESVVASTLQHYGGENVAQCLTAADIFPVLATPKLVNDKFIAATLLKLQADASQATVEHPTVLVDAAPKCRSNFLLVNVSNSTSNTIFVPVPNILKSGIWCGSSSVDWLPSSKDQIKLKTAESDAMAPSNCKSYCRPTSTRLGGTRTPKHSDPTDSVELSARTPTVKNFLRLIKLLTVPTALY